MTQSFTDLLLNSFYAAVAAADPLKVLAAHLPTPARGKTYVVGAGKAAASMALAVEQAWPHLALEGLVVTRYQHGLSTSKVQVVEAGHPIPDQAGRQAAVEMLCRASQLGPQDLLLALVSGGGSSLLSLPVDGVSLADLKEVTSELLRCGAPIEQINVVRKHLSRISGGQLAAAAARGGAQVCALLISDVTGDQATNIASGPCAPDPSTYVDAQAVLARYNCAVPKSVEQHLTLGAQGLLTETPKPGDPLFKQVHNQLIATSQQSLAAAAAIFEQAGVRSVILGDTVTGEAREVAKVYAALVRQIKQHHTPFAPPVALISGGECTVTLPATAQAQKTRGGRCTEFLLSLAITLDGVAGVYALAADTDGIDGTESNAGAWLSPQTLSRAAAHNVQAQACLDQHDAWAFFNAAGSLIHTGPTRTNVNDYRVILVT